MSLLPEGLVAEAAAEGSDVLMHTHMYHQVVGFGKGLTAHLPIFKDPVTSLVVPYGLVDIGHIAGLDLVKASVVVAHLSHHRCGRRRARSRFDSGLRSGFSSLSGIGIGGGRDRVIGRGRCQSIQTER